MLQGLNVEENPLLKRQCQYSNLEIIYSDKSIIVINKPSGMLSVKGKTEETSVYDFIKIKYPETDGPIIVHRLDMDTSGLMVLAKNKETHKLLQKQFLDRTVKKRYKAILDGIIKEDKGIISLPLRPDFEDRPRQLVDFEFGKEAITEYSIDLISDNKTKIYFHPLTGRTHQLRVHSAHSLGLNSPILGDPIYGKKKDRLYLHAEYLEFKHPETGEIISFNAKAPF